MPTNYFRQLLIVSLAILTSGCASSYITNSDYQFDSTNPNEGMVVLSTRILDKCATQQDPLGVSFLKYEGLINGEMVNGFFLLNNQFIKPDFHHPIGYLWIKQLEAGQYHLYDVLHSYKYPPSYDSPISVHFTIHPHKITYLGEIYVDAESCGKRIQLYFHNQGQRDGKIFNARMKNLNASLFDYQIPVNH